MCQVWQNGKDETGYEWKHDILVYSKKLHVPPECCGLLYLIVYASMSPTYYR